MNNILLARKPWIAAFMSLALPGWGQLYNGQANRAIWCFLIFALLLLPGITAFALATPPSLMLPLLVVGFIGTLALWLYCARDAYVVAQRTLSYSLKSWQTSGLYTLVFISCALLILPTLTIAMRTHLVQPFYIPSTSMAPNLMKGDYIFANMYYNCIRCRPVQRGDMAIFTYPNDRSMHYVKRIVALPGDRVQVSNQQLLINGKTLTIESSGDIQREQSGGQTWQVQGMEKMQDSGAEQVVAPGHVFVLGDNRSLSKDSRDFGAVPLPDVVGRVRQIWFSKSEEDGVRWGRIGQLVH